MSTFLSSVLCMKVRWCCAKHLYALELALKMKMVFHRVFIRGQPLPSVLEETRSTLQAPNQPPPADPGPSSSLPSYSHDAPPYQGPLPPAPSSRVSHPLPLLTEISACVDSV